MKETTTILLSQYYFSKEAINFITANYVVYLPALATLANLAAKEIDNSYYDLKSDMVDEISQVATSQGWRTFETLDYNVPNHPYIYYVDCNRFAQMSFHGNYSRPTTTTKGKWSGIAVQEQAPTLIANRLKKDGFKGNVWDLKQITLNIMYGQNVVEAAHLYKGQNYLFVANNELVVLQGNTVVEPTDSLLQSFITRFRKNESPSSEQSEKGVESSDQNQSKGEQQGNTEQTNSTNGNDAESADSQNCGTNGGKTPLTQNSQSNANGLNEYAQQVTSEELGELITEDNGIAKQSPEEFANSGNNLENSSQVHDDLHEFQGDLGLPHKKEVFEGEQSENSNTSKTATKQVSSSNNTSGFYDLLQSLKPQSKGGGGGGLQLNVNDHQAKAKVSPLIQEALQKLAGGKSLSQKKEGFLSYCGKKVVKALTTSPQKLPIAKYDRPVDKVYFFVDTSGSVATFGNFIISMIKSAKQAENIIVWSGSEAHPCKDENKGVDKIEFIYDFAENMQAWINLEQPQVGSTLVFWGDLQDANIDPVKLKKVCQNYKCVWLHCIERHQVKQYNRSKAKKIIQAGFKLVKAVVCEKSLARGINSLL